MASSIGLTSIAPSKSCLRRNIPLLPNLVRSGGGPSLPRPRQVILAMASSMYSFSQGKQIPLDNYKYESPYPPGAVVGNSHGWRALLDDGYLFLWNPTTHQTIDLPPLYTLPISEHNSSVSKVILSCPPDQDECFAVMTFGPDRKLARCCPRWSNEWTPFGGLHELDQGRTYTDFVYSNKHKLFLCLAQLEGKEGFDLEIWDLQNKYSRVGLRPNLHEKQTHEIPPEQLRRHLVYEEQSDQLFIVTQLLRKSYKTVGFHVHRIGFYDDKYGPQFINPGMRRDELCYMEDSLDGVLISVGINNAFAEPAAEFVKPNSIYFTGDDGAYGIFDYQNKILSICYCYYPSHIRMVKHQRTRPLWFTYTSKAT